MESLLSGTTMKKYRVFATCDIGGDALNRLVDHGYAVEVYEPEEGPSKQLILKKVRSGVDALITTVRDEIDGEVFKAGHKTLKVVAQNAVGFDNIDRDAANRCGIPFTHTADVLTETTAEFAFFILGCVSRKLYPSETLVREHKWKTWHPYLPFLGDEVTGKTLAVIGTGRIGQALILKSTGLNMDILCHDAVLQDHEFVEKVQALFDLKASSGLSTHTSTIQYVSFQEALQRADYVSLHVPLSNATHHLINRAALKLMKPSAYLINTSRGPVVDEEALYQALTEKEITGAALDVFEQEPLAEDSPLREPELEERVRLFHHFASGGRQTRLSPDPDVGMAGRCVQGVIDILEGHYDGDSAKMPYVVNKEAFESR